MIVLLWTMSWTCLGGWGRGSQNRFLKDTDTGNSIRIISTQTGLWYTGGNKWTILFNATRPSTLRMVKAEGFPFFHHMQASFPETQSGDSPHLVLVCCLALVHVAWQIYNRETDTFLWKLVVEINECQQIIWTLSLFTAPLVFSCPACSSLSGATWCNSARPITLQLRPC